jgi:hypothetical protein
MYVGGVAAASAVVFTEASTDRTIGVSITVHRTTQTVAVR